MRCSTVSIATTGRSALFLLAIVLASVSPAAADPCDVVVDGGDHYSSIGSALEALPDQQGHHLLISGVCSEAVWIDSHRDLTLEGTAGATISWPEDFTGDWLVALVGSDRVSFRNLTIVGDPTVSTSSITANVFAWNSRDLLFEDCTIERSGYFGAWLRDSLANVNGTVIQDNVGPGIRLDIPSSHVQLHHSDAGPTIIQRNSTGVFVNKGYLVLMGGVEVRDNYIGVYQWSGNVDSLCDVDCPSLTNNSYGTYSEGGWIQLRGLTVRDHSRWAVVGLGGSSVYLGSCTIDGNGTGPDSGGGIISLGSYLEVWRTDVVGNFGRGTYFTDRSTGRVIASEVSGNGGEGIDVQGMSVAAVYTGSSVHDNGGFDLRCSPNSHARGDKKAVERMVCPGFNNAPDPVPGRPVP